MICLQCSCLVLRNLKMSYPREIMYKHLHGSQFAVLVSSSYIPDPCEIKTPIQTPRLQNPECKNPLLVRISVTELTGKSKYPAGAD